MEPFRCWYLFMACIHSKASFGSDTGNSHVTDEVVQPEHQTQNLFQVHTAENAEYEDCHYNEIWHLCKDQFFRLYIYWFQLWVESCAFEAHLLKFFKQNIHHAESVCLPDNHHSANVA